MGTAWYRPFNEPFVDGIVHNRGPKTIFTGEIYPRLPGAGKPQSEGISRKRSEEQRNEGWKRSAVFRSALGSEQIGRRFGDWNKTWGFP